MKVALFSPMPPERSGIADYSALLLPGAAGPLRGRRRPAAAAKKPPRGTDLCVYHIGNNPDAHGWIVDALRRTPGVVVLHDFVLHHLVAGLTIGRRDGHGYLDAMEREGGVVGRLLGHAVLDKRIPPLWENRPQDFHLAGEVLDLATGLIVALRATCATARGRPATAAPSGSFPTRLSPFRRARPPTSLGNPLFGVVRQRQREQARAAAARGVRPPAARPRRRGAAARRRHLTRLRPRPPAAAARPRRRGPRPRGLRRRGATVGADEGVRRARQPALADDGRDLRHGDPRALARQAARRQRRRLVLRSCPATSR